MPPQGFELVFIRGFSAPDFSRQWTRIGNCPFAFLKKRLTIFHSFPLFSTLFHCFPLFSTLFHSSFPIICSLQPVFWPARPSVPALVLTLNSGAWAPYSAGEQGSDRGNVDCHRHAAGT